MSMIELPVCRWRREPTGDGRHMCVSPKMVVGRSGVPDAQCTTCRYRDHPPPPRPPGLCLHLGPRVDVRDCQPCAARAGRPVQVGLHACALHDRCSVQVQLPGVACCDSCPDRTSRHHQAAAGDVRHMTYHLYPRGDYWRWNLQQLKQRISLFNGRRLMAVALDSASATLDEVRADLAGHDVELLPVVNNQDMREEASHMRLVELLEGYQGAGDVTWYGHAKGVSTWAVYDGVARWTEEMYRGTLDYWPLVRRLLIDAAAVGCYRRLWCGLPNHNVRWHFSGSFRWIRNRDLYSRNWRTIGHGYCAGEGYPAMQFQLSETACIHGEFGSGGMGLYYRSSWDQWAGEEADRFHARNAPDRLSPLLCTVILTAHRQPDLVHQAIESVQAQTTDAWQLLIVDSGPISASGAYDRYLRDARISYMLTGETPEQSATRCPQSWAINEAWRRGRVRGDLIFHLSDDDVYSPTWLAAIIDQAVARPDQGAWYGPARRVRVHPSGLVQQLGTLPTVGVARPANTLRCRVDGFQVAHRRAARVDWPERRELAPHADGWWMDALAANTPIHPVDALVGVHRHTPLSAFTT